MHTHTLPSRIILLAFLILTALQHPLQAQVRLPRLLSDGMVLQRGAPIPVWGWASPGESVTLEFNGKKYLTKADEQGQWQVQLAPQKAGGPYRMLVRGTNEITVSNIMVGEVWVCSGQSNMELKMRRVRPLYEKDIAGADNPNIRLFEVPQRYDFNTAQTDFRSGAWKAVTPQQVLDFSAVAYFFAQNLYEKYHVPIGLINASLGGSPAEAWMSESALQTFPELAAEAIRYKDSLLIQQIDRADRERAAAWYASLRQKDIGYAAPNHSWLDDQKDFSDWKTMQVPGYWSKTELGAVNGVVWFRKNVQVLATQAGKPAFLNLGCIVDADSVYLNGVLVGSTSYKYPPRWYKVPGNVLREGENTLVVRVINNSGEGGFVLDKPYELIANGDTIDLRGDWQYRLGATMEPLAPQTFIRWKPTGLFNAMLHPLFQFRIKGVIWYQGEGNTRRAAEYERLFPAMIRDWRTHWKQGDFPFLFVQLANFLEPQPEPGESDWARLRESQRKTLSLPHTGMAVAIDIGEWNDIHPLNKKEVGRRLALLAQRVAYKDSKAVCNGPTLRKCTFSDGKAVLDFDPGGSGLAIRGGGELKGFALAGPDQRFYWANARLDGRRIVVECPAVSSPVALRYAWADNPQGANLINREGLPASPFRTDDWEVSEDTIKH